MKFLLRLLALSFIVPGVLVAEDQERFSEAELDQMLAPVALYPDALLAQILTASTYPLEIVEAHRWVQDRGLEGEEAVEAADEEKWDPSVKALVAFPDLLQRLNEDLTWTQQLGEAVLLQEEEVMASVQKLRAKAYAAGSLSSLENVEVRREREVIYIEPRDPHIIYVPYYQPTVVYGSWWWPSHPPVYWRPFSSVLIRTGSTQIVWTRGYRFSHRYFYSHPDWHRRHIVIHHHYHKRPKHIHRSGRDWSRYGGGDRWRHNFEHRRGARYRSATLREQYVKRHFPEEQQANRGDRIDQRRREIYEAERARQRREVPGQNVATPGPDSSHRSRRDGLTRSESGSAERREFTRSNRDVNSERIRQRLMRDRAERQRTEQANQDTILNRSRLAGQRRDDLTRSETGSTERRESARPRRDVNSEQIRQRLMRDRAERQRTEQVYRERRPQVPVPGNVQSGNSENSRAQTPELGNRGRRPEHRVSGNRGSRHDRSRFGQQQSQRGEGQMRSRHSGRSEQMGQRGNRGSSFRGSNRGHSSSRRGSGAAHSHRPPAMHGER